VAYWPILLIIGAIAAVVGGIWYLWENWETVTKLLGDAWKVVTDTVGEAFAGAMGIIDQVKAKVMGFIDMVMGAIGKVGQLLGLTDDASKVKVAVSVGGGAAQASANNSLNATGGVIGMAGSNTTNSSTVTQTTTITGTTIQINSPDPAKAGEAVRQELDRMNKQATRNGQSAVAL
jgi:hypothetical protein